MERPSNRIPSTSSFCHAVRISHSLGRPSGNGFNKRNKKSTASNRTPEISRSNLVRTQTTPALTPLHSDNEWNQSARPNHRSVVLFWALTPETRGEGGQGIAQRKSTASPRCGRSACSAWRVGRSAETAPKRELGGKNCLRCGSWRGGYVEVEVFGAVKTNETLVKQRGRQEITGTGPSDAFPTV